MRKAICETQYLRGECSKKWRAWRQLSFAILCCAWGIGTSIGHAAQATQIPDIVSEIRRADYSGERDSLERLYERLAPHVRDAKMALPVRYWRGFAMWRRAFNGFNESVSPDELDRDLSRALTEFEAAIALDSSFVEAKIGAGSCLSNLMFLHRADPERSSSLITQGARMLRSASAQDPGNPRLLWVSGANQWHAPPEYGGGHEKAMATYRSGLPRAQAEWQRRGDPLTIDWGEPELLMNLAWAYLNHEVPRPDSADAYARSALARVPHWHYVKDILLPQIVEARAKVEP